MFSLVRNLFSRKVVNKELPFKCSIHGLEDLGGRVPSNVCVDENGMLHPVEVNFRCSCSCTSYYDLGKVICTSCGTSYVKSSNGFKVEFVPAEEGFELGV